MLLPSPYKADKQLTRYINQTVVFMAAPIQGPGFITALGVALYYMCWMPVSNYLTRISDMPSGVH